MGFANIYLFSLLFVEAMMCVVFVLAQYRKDNSIVDIFWGTGFCLIALNSYLLTWEYDPRKTLMLMMVLAWGVRLSIYLYLRNKGKGEDYRYAAWRKEWGENAARKAFWKVFMLQGFFMFIISLPVLHVMNFSYKFGNVLDLIGLAVWLTGFLIESIGDYQLKVFKSRASNKGRIMQEGLWSVSRHPNYLGEVLVWWGIFIVSLNADRWYISLISPMVITWLLTRVSGVPMLEKKYRDNAEFQEYAARVPAFFPTLDGWKKVFSGKLRYP